MRKLLSPVLLVVAAITVSAQEPDVQVEELDRAEIEAELSVTPMEQVTEEARQEFVRAARFADRYNQIGDMESAVEQLERADELIPDHPAVIHNLAVVYLKTGRYREAQEQITRYLDLYPRGAHADSVMSMQIDLDFQKDLQARIEKTQNYVELVNRASFEFEQGDYDSSLEKFRNAEDLDPEDASAVFNQAVALEAMGEYGQATERLRRFLALSSDSEMRSEVDRRIFMLEQEIEGRRSDLVCAFCGWRLGPGQYWCPRCWRGPYLVDDPRWSSRPCGPGASATRSSYYGDGRVALNEPLSCLYEAPNYKEALRYSRIRQRGIQEEREADGWVFEDDVIARLEADGATVLVLEQGDYLHSATAAASGVSLDFEAEDAGEILRLMKEDLSVDGRLYHKSYTYDSNGRIIREDVWYRAVDECGHLVFMTADYVYQGDLVTQVDLSGEIEGYVFEGKPNTRWSGSVTFSYGEDGRLTGETFQLGEFVKTVTERPDREWDKLYDRAFPGWRRNRPIDISSRADYCDSDGTRLIDNSIDLRPFYSVSPSIATALENGVTKIEVTYTYPSGFTPPK